MKVALGCDHAGFPLKSIVLETIRQSGHQVLDVGTNSPEPVDYPDIAERVGRAIAEKRAQRGILLCGSGVGACIAANKIPGIYAGVCHDSYSAHQGVEHDDMNVLCLGARIIGPEPARELTCAYLSARFSKEERHRRRVEKIRRIESANTGKTPR
ncbi:MAG: ribose 5-phosphate isomerase B [Anaerolineales bacterium]|nr:ribose 5-phosphate isomerase B [Anaerolineales bacterium]